MTPRYCNCAYLVFMFVIWYFKGKNLQEIKVAKRKSWEIFGTNINEWKAGLPLIIVAKLSIVHASGVLTVPLPIFSFLESFVLKLPHEKKFHELRRKITSKEMFNCISHEKRRYFSNVSKSWKDCF